MTIYFYSNRELPYGCFSNFSAHGFHLDALWWPTSEHYFQAQKFLDATYAETIRNAPSPKLAADLGRSRNYPLRPDWEEAKIAIMRQAVTRKFETHADIREILLSTGEQSIVENAPGDYFWGCGKDGTGKNVLGKILVEVRDMLRAGYLKSTS